MTLSDPTLYLASGALAAVALVLLGLIALRAWRDWVALKREELALHAAHPALPDAAAMTAGARIEMADLKERLRKLEAIAAGVDL